MVPAEEKGIMLFDNSELNTFIVLLNKLMDKKYDWFKKINITKAGLSIGRSYFFLEGDIYLDYNWAKKQYYELNGAKLFKLDDQVALSDLIGTDLAVEIAKIFKKLFSHIASEITPKYTSFSWISVKYDDEIINEETSAPLQVRRRITEIDWQIEFAIKDVLRQNSNICNMGEDGFVETVVEKTIEHMYWDFFSDMDDNSKEWTSSYYLMIRYINDKFQNMIQKIYHDKCED